MSLKYRKIKVSQVLNPYLLGGDRTSLLLLQKELQMFLFKKHINHAQRVIDSFDTHHSD